jgi:hypothetical protein
LCGIGWFVTPRGVTAVAYARTIAGSLIWFREDNRFNNKAAFYAALLLNVIKKSESDFPRVFSPARKQYDH